MNQTASTSRSPERWAHFRFSVIGPLLAAPASRGQLQGQLQELAAKKWRHPISGDWVVFGLSTIERISVVVEALEKSHISGPGALQYP